MPKLPGAQCPVTEQTACKHHPCLCYASWNHRSLCTQPPPWSTASQGGNIQGAKCSFHPTKGTQSRPGVLYWIDGVFVHQGTFCMKRALSMRVTQLNKQHQWFITLKCPDSGWWPVWCYVSSSSTFSLNKWHQEHDSAGRTMGCKSPIWMLIPDFCSPAKFFSPVNSPCKDRLLLHIWMVPSTVESLSWAVIQPPKYLDSLKQSSNHVPELLWTHINKKVTKRKLNGQPSKVKDDSSWNYLLTDTQPGSYIPVAHPGSLRIPSHISQSSSKWKLLISSLNQD